MGYKIQKLIPSPSGHATTNAPFLEVVSQLTRPNGVPQVMQEWQWLRENQLFTVTLISDPENPPSDFEIKQILKVLAPPVSKKGGQQQTAQLREFKDPYQNRFESNPLRWQGGSGPSSLLFFLQPLLLACPARAQEDTATAGQADALAMQVEETLTTSAPPDTDRFCSPEYLKKNCSKVPTEKQCRPLEPGILATLSDSLETGGGCLKGTLDFVTETVSSIWSMAKGSWNYATDSAYRAETNSMIGVIADQIRQEPTSYFKKVASRFWQVLSETCSDFLFCYNRKEQSKLICQAAANLLTGKILAKILLGEALNDAEKLSLRKFAKDTLSDDHPEPSVAKKGTVSEPHPTPAEQWQAYQQDSQYVQESTLPTNAAPANSLDQAVDLSASQRALRIGRDLDPESGERYIDSMRSEAAAAWGDKMEHLPSPGQTDKTTDMRRMGFDAKRDNVFVVDQQNKLTLKSLNNSPVKERPGRISTASKDKINSIFKAVADNPTAATCQLPTYDPTGRIGYCFGRAVAGHIEALKQGISKDSIKKIWAVGSPSRDAMAKNWGYHVATAIRGSDGKWYVMDTLYPKPLTVEEWYLSLTEKNGSGKTRIYYTEPDRMGLKPTSEPVKKWITDNDGFTNNTYFEDLMKTFQEESRQNSLKKKNQKPR